MPTKTAAAPLELVEANPSRQTHIDLRELVERKWENPREPVKPDQVKGLAATMERVGLLHPIVVMPVVIEAKDKSTSGGYVLLAGHRRVAAAKLLGWKTLPAHVLVAPKGSELSGEHLARTVALIENGQREDLDPLRDCEVVEALLAEEGATLDSVAAELGRPKSWVARRARLTGLCERARKLSKEKGPIAHWPAAWLELLALLPDDAQVLLAENQKRDYDKIESQHDISTAVRTLLKRLGTAPWDLADAALEPKAGACTTCQKHTGAQADLFEEPRKVELKEAQCLDSQCFARKLAVWRDKALQAAKAKHGPELAVLRARELSANASARGNRDNWRGEDAASQVEEELEFEDRKAKPAKGAPRVLEPHQVAPAKQGDKGTVPVLVVDGKDAGKVKWMRLGKPETNGDVGRAPRKSGPTAKPKSLAQKREALNERRRKHVVLALREVLATWRDGELSPPLAALTGDPEALLDLAGAWGVTFEAHYRDPNHKDAGVLDDVGKDGKGLEAGDKRRLLVGNRKSRNGRVLRGLMTAWFGALGFGRTLEVSQPEYSEAEAILMSTRQTVLLDNLRADALAFCPEPEAWGGGEKVTKLEKGAKAPKAKPAVKAKAATPAKRRKPSGKDAASGEREED